MRRQLIGMMVVGLGLLAGVVVADDCSLPPFVQVGKTYEMGTATIGGAATIGGKHLKVVEIDAARCWLRIEETVNMGRGVDDRPQPRTNVFWLNAKLIVFIREPQP